MNETQQKIYDLLAQGKPYTCTAISTRIVNSENTTQNNLSKMRKAGLIELTRSGNQVLWHLPKPTAAQTDAQPERSDWRAAGPYDGKELRRTPGIPDERFVAFSLPSLMSGKRVTPRRIA